MISWRSTCSCTTGHLSGVLDFGEVAAEAAASDFAKWEFSEGERFPVEWIQAGYGDPSLFEAPNDRTYRALWLAVGLWRMRWYHLTGFRAGVEAGRDRLLSEQAGDRTAPTARSRSPI